MDDKVILLLVFVSCLLVARILIPKQKSREAMLATIFTQTITWVISLSVVKFGLVTFPAREFPKATSPNIALEFFAFPLANALFNVYYPLHQRVWVKILYWSVAVSGITILAMVIERYTDLIEFIHFTWYWTALTFFTELLVTRWYVTWFFRVREHGKSDLSNAHD